MKKKIKVEGRSSAEIPHWRTTAKKTVAESPFLRIEEHRREEEESGRHGYFFILHAPDWVNIIPITEQGEVVMIEQFRHGSEQIELELPSGIVDPDETPAEAALRELLEETGYEMSDRSEFKKIGEVTPNPAFQRNTSYSYVVTNVRPTGTTAFDENEDIRIRLVPRHEIEKLIQHGEIRHSLIVTAFYWLTLAGY